MPFTKDYTDVHLTSRFWTAILLIHILLLFGFSGYYFYFGYHWVDAFYMTVITIGTVGFGEVVPLNYEGKIFTALLILFSIFIFAYAVTTVSAYLISIYSDYSFKLKKMYQKIDGLKDHTIICGYGRNGKQAAAKLSIYKKPFVIIEQNKDIIEQLLSDGMLYIEGNATEDESLVRAGVTNASHMISTLPSDADNVFITLTARQLNPGIHIYSRASDESSVKKLKIAGANNVIMPDKIGGDHMASLIVAPDLVEFIDNLSSSHNGTMNIQEIVLTTHDFVTTIEDLKIKSRTGCTVIGYKTKQGDYIVNPEPELKIEKDGRIIVLGNDLQIKKLNQEFNIS